jgi:hypothetical protein
VIIIIIIISNFRPISLLPNINKFFELILHHQLLQFCNANSIFPDAQHGFRDNLSTETCMLDFCNSLYSFMDKKYACVSIFVDFSKAFDLLNHSTLLLKLNSIGLSKNAIALLTSYLTHRIQQVMWDGFHSSLAPITSGVPQGSVLGPLLFCIYIHDMPGIFKNCQVFQYADDTTLLFHFNKHSIEYSVINLELERLSEYCILNSLKLNSSKTKAMLFCQDPPSSLPLHVDNSSIEFISDFKVLVIMSSML